MYLPLCGLGVESSSLPQHSLGESSFLQLLLLCLFLGGKVDLARSRDQRLRDQEGGGGSFHYCCYHLLFWAAGLLTLQGRFSYKIKKNQMFF